MTAYLSEIIPATGIPTSRPNVLAVPINATLSSWPVQSMFSCTKKWIIGLTEDLITMRNGDNQNVYHSLTRVAKRSSLFLIKMLSQCILLDRLKLCSLHVPSLEAVSMYSNRKQFSGRPFL